MDLSEVFHLSRNSSIHDLIPLTQIKSTCDIVAHSKNDYLIGYTVDEFTKTYPSIDPAKIFFSCGLTKTFYFDKVRHILFPIHLYGTEFLSAGGDTLESIVNKMVSDFDYRVQRRDYSIIIVGLDDRMRMEYFNMLIDDGVTEEVYKYFIEAYLQSDCGCDAVSHENMLKVLQTRTEDEKKAAAENVQTNLACYEREVSIYRGQGSRSTPYLESWSWTTDVNIAHFFATRYGEDGSSVVVGKTTKDKIIDYIKNEKECLVSPHDIEIVEIINLHGLSWLEEKMTSYLIHMYQKYRELIIEEYEHDTVNMDHSMLHSARTLLLSLLLGSAYKLKHDEMTTLALSAVFHDIGRDNDCIDDLHGKRSAEIFKWNHEAFVKEDKFAAFIIEYHCLDDMLGYEYIETHFQGCKRVALLYNIFKDADALDRVRFGKDEDGLDVSYLRLGESRKMTLLAKMFLRQIKIEQQSEAYFHGV